MLDAEGFVISPLVEVMPGVYLEEWHHHEPFSYRYFREDPSTRTLKVASEATSLASFHSTGSADSFLEAARVTKQADGFWHAQAWIPVHEAPVLERVHNTRKEAVEWADEALSKFLTVRVHSAYPEAQKVAFKLSAARIVLNTINERCKWLSADDRSLIQNVLRNTEV